MADRERRRVGVVVFDGFKSLDATGPMEVFDEANLAGADYELLVLAPGGRSARASNGLQVRADADVSQPLDDLHTVIVTGGDALPLRAADPALIRSIQLLADRTGRMAAVCTGAFLLAAAGLLDGRRATTHWRHTKTFAAAYPSIDVESDALFVHDGHVHTSAGVTAGIDLSLALVETDYGGDLARRVAQALAVFLQRPGGQSQFSPSLLAPRPRTAPLRRLIDDIAADPAGDLTTEAMAARASMTPRHLTRLFRAEVGMTPHAYVESIRLRAACAALEQGVSVTETITRAGFPGGDSLRRAFRVHLGVTPQEYQRRFSTSGTQVQSGAETVVTRRSLS